MKKGILVGLFIGLLLGFIDSYTYAISGYTTSEISLIIVPFLVMAIFKIIDVRYSSYDLITAIALAFGICMTTTLSSGMYITFGFLRHVSNRLNAYGMDIAIPEYIFSGSFPDLVALPTYIALALISFGGALIAFAFRNHFIEKERLKYPIGLASAILIKLLQKSSISIKIVVTLIILGFSLQFIAMRMNLVLDLTPIVSTVAPGAVLALSFWPILIGLLVLIPLYPLKSISMGSVSTYLLLIPLSIALFSVKTAPAISYEEALYNYSPISIGLNIGVVLIVTLFYLIIYSTTLYMSLNMILKMRMEGTAFILGVAMILLMLYLALVIGGISTILIHTLPLIFIHILLTLANLRVVGETGTGSQALLPLVTFYMYFFGFRDIKIYATLDPYTGIPMPQVIGGASLNLLRLARLFKYSVVKALLYFGIGIFVGSFTTYIYGNIMTHVYGFESDYMPLTRWIPCVIWMASIYSGKLGSTSISVIVLGAFIGLLIVIAGLRKVLSPFGFVVGMTMPPDIGVLSLVVYAIKMLMVRLGVEVHEKMIIFAILFLLGCGIAVIFNTILYLVVGVG
ncbi:MAG: hypothetical protein QW101_07735 [Ignisphaera sp.]|uniref:Uncharacterized protein n=1 Tax=Ignisphaera aggregans TaxID=334771 RepID=A0A7J3MWF3_9CREN